MHRLFIYGTLLPGLRLAAQMQGALFVGAAEVAGRLVDV
ncbi:MAG: gamma-glutamylcyclotransferase, partial [Betaproteobacteria bacterium]|nr:gamma-glutamylcyclotransferase [Betaproteobacteria bacterium]